MKVLLPQRVVPLTAASILWLLLALPAAAATLRVTTTVDDDGLCLPDDCSLREAVLAAHVTPEADRIEVPPGIHLLTAQDPTGDVEGTPNSGTIAITVIDVEIHGLGPAEQVIIDADRTGSVFFISFNSRVGLYDLTLRKARGLTGGAIHSYGESLRIYRCIFEDNYAWRGFGGGIRVTGGSEVVVSDSSFVGNSADRGGGGLASIGLSGGPSIRIVNSTFSGNSALTGGAVWARNFGSLRIIHSSFVGNSTTPAGSGDALSTNLSNVTIYNSLFANDCFYFQVPFPTSNGGNVEGPAATCFDPAGGDLMGSVELGIAPLAYYGGPTPTHALLPYSPAVNAGRSAECRPADQRGVPRPQRSGCDSGAFELESPSAAEIPSVGTFGIVLLSVILLGVGFRRLR